MMNKSKKYVLPAVALLVGVGTIFLFQNCSSGSLPSLDQQQSASTTAPAVAYSTVYVGISPNPVVTGTSAVVTVTGGNSNFVGLQTSCGGTVVKNADGSYAFNAPAGLTANTPCIVTMTDSLGNSGFASFNVTPPATTTTTTTTPPARVAPPSVQIYQTTDPAGTTNIYVTDPNQFQYYPGTAHHFLASNASAQAVPFYRCQIPTGWTSAQGNPYFYIDTQSSNCENHPNAPKTQIGFIYPDSTMPNTRALYRYYVIQPLYQDGELLWTIRNYYETFNQADTAQGTSDGIVGWVPIN